MATTKTEDAHGFVTEIQTNVHLYVKYENITVHQIPSIDFNRYD